MNLQQVLDEIIEAIRNGKDGPTTRDSSMTRFQASSLSNVNDIRSFINDTEPDEPDSIDELGSLHIVIPNDSRSLPENVTELRFHFFDIHKQKLSFHYIESYSCCDDKFKKPSDGYYFMPGSDNSLSESDYLSRKVEVGTALDPDNETTAHVVAVLY